MRYGSSRYRPMSKVHVGATGKVERHDTEGARTNVRERRRRLEKLLLDLRVCLLRWRLRSTTSLVVVELGESARLR